MINAPYREHSVGGLQGVHLWDDPEFHAIASANQAGLTVPTGRCDLDADGFDDLVIMGLGPYQQNTGQLGVRLGRRTVPAPDWTAKRRGRRLPGDSVTLPLC